MKDDNFIAMVNNDINRCDKTNPYNIEENLNFLNELYGKYSKVSVNFPDVEFNPLDLRGRGTAAFQYINLVRGFLIAYSLNNCEDYKFDETKSSGINVITNISNVNENINHNISFTEVREKIENMTSLPDKEIDEILEKINELEKIVNSSYRKTKKWNKASDIIKWMADKGVDIGISLIPLLLQIQ